MTQENKCLAYWDLCSNISIDAAVSLWCNVEPSELSSLKFSTSCMDVKRVLLEDALREGRLDYISTSQWGNAGIQELISKNELLIKKESLRRWFLEIFEEDRPAFLFDESRSNNLPDGSEVAEMNANRALATMAILLSKQSVKYSNGNKPNASAIAEAINPLAMEIFGENVRGFESFNKRLGKALKELEKNNPF